MQSPTTTADQSSATLAARVGRWLPIRPRSAEPDDLPLFCLPHAGGGASAFRSWVDAVPGAAVLPVQPPGREARLREEPHLRMETLAAELADVILAEADDEPFAVYGHSLGALIAFEAVREIRRRGGPDPVRLVVSGCSAPHLETEDGPKVTAMSDAEVVRMLRRLGGTPEWLLSDPDALQMILPPFRADFSVKENYVFGSESPLLVPITVIASTDDPRAPLAAQQAWRDHTIAPVRLHTLLGGHFAVFEQADLTRHLLAEALVPPTAAGW